MPNWIKNIVVIEATETLLTTIRESLKSNNNEFDFNNVLPLPKELDGTQSPTRIITQEEYNNQEERIKNGHLTELEKNWGLSRGITKELEIEYIDKFGASNWYEWQIENWGVKWNASEVEWIDGNYVTFNTAWECPHKLLKNLSIKYPDATFFVKYSDEDFGYNVGEYTLKGGVAISTNIPLGGTRKALELAMTIQYGAPSEYYYFDDTFECVEELNDYIQNLIDIAYDNNIEPNENWSVLVLEEFKRKALIDEKYELIVFIENL